MRYQPGLTSEYESSSSTLMRPGGEDYHGRSNIGSDLYTAAAAESRLLTGRNYDNYVDSTAGPTTSSARGANSNFLNSFTKVSFFPFSSFKTRAQPYI